MSHIQKLPSKSNIFDLEDQKLFNEEGNKSMVRKKIIIKLGGNSR